MHFNAACLYQIQKLAYHVLHLPDTPKYIPLILASIYNILDHANALSILLNYKSAYPWLMNNFIQLTSYDDYYLDFCDFWYRNCPLLECQRIKIILFYSNFLFIYNISLNPQINAKKSHALNHAWLFLLFLCFISFLTL